MARRARPTLRCLREDLGRAVPPADTPLDEVPHPLLAKARERFADDGAPRERIASVDDQVLTSCPARKTNCAGELSTPCGSNAVCRSPCTLCCASRFSTGESMPR